ncbi:MAG: DUF4917 family protein [Chloroflexi bacterium]|nr:DUF4917 family protein [Chloroflexota bacterium]
MQKPVSVEQWSDIESQGWQSLIVGNGGSIAVHPQFNYASLLTEAIRISPNGINIRRLFDALDTTDFEYVLAKLRSAGEVLKGLDLTVPEVGQYQAEVKEALVRAVHSVHPNYADVEDQLRLVGAFLRRFRKAAVLNYDVLVYWAMLLVNDQIRLSIKDGFTPSKVDQALRFWDDWPNLLNSYNNVAKPTLVVYPHGALMLESERLGGTAKIVSDGSISASDSRSKLLTTITANWEDKDVVPLFVSEGDSNQKSAAINRNHYLSVVNRHVLRTFGPNVVIYGWSIGKQDAHIASQVFRARNSPSVQNVAVSVRTIGLSSEQISEHCLTIDELLHRFNSSISVRYFDADSAGAWCHD